MIPITPAAATALIAALAENESVRYAVIGNESAIMTAIKTATGVIYIVGSVGTFSANTPPPPSKGLAQFGSFYQTVADVAGTIAANNDPVRWYNAGAVNTAGLGLSVVIPGGVIIGAGAGGKYKVSYQVSGVEPNAFAVYVNGGKNNASVSGSGAGTQQNNGSVLLQLNDGDVVTLRSDQCPAAVTLALAGTTDTAMKVAEIVFEKLAD